MLTFLGERCDHTLPPVVIVAINEVYAREAVREIEMLHERKCLYVGKAEDLRGVRLLQTILVPGWRNRRDADDIAEMIILQDLDILRLADLPLRSPGRTALDL